MTRRLADLRVLEEKKKKMVVYTPSVSCKKRNMRAGPSHNV